MKQKIILELDKMISNDENVTYRELAKRLDTVASTITYQFGSKDKLIEHYLDYKFSQAYSTKKFTDFSELLIFSYHTNFNLFNKFKGDITVSTLADIQNKLLSKHYNSFEQLYIKHYGAKNKTEMIKLLSLIHLMAINYDYYSSLFNYDSDSVDSFILNLL